MGSGASSNNVQTNHIGYAVQVGNTTIGTGNGGPGIQVNYGASRNVIGAPLPIDNPMLVRGNDIEFNSGPGIWVAPNSGNSNVVRLNSIAQNGGLAIDLGALGPTPNGPPGSEANHLQAWPTVLQGLYNADVLSSASSWVHVTMQETTFPAAPVYIDVYLSGTCQLGNGRGDAEVPLVTQYVLPHSDGLIDQWIRVPYNFGAFDIQNGGFLAATATVDDGSMVTGDTSEIGACIHSSGDLIFRDDSGG